MATSKQLQFLANDAIALEVREGLSAVAQAVAVQAVL